MPKKNHPTRYVIEGDVGEIGVLIVDWTKRSIDIHGIAGDTVNDVTLERAKQLCSEVPEGCTAYPFVVWPENADGCMQLAVQDSVEEMEQWVSEEVQ